MTIGQKLELFIKENFKSVAGFAKKIGVERTHLYPYLNDKNVPGGDLLKKFAKEGCDINWLLSDDEPVMDSMVVRANSPPINIDRDRPDAEDRIKELEEENRLLRDSIDRICEAAQAIKSEKAKYRKPFKP